MMRWKWMALTIAAAFAIAIPVFTIRQPQFSATGYVWFRPFGHGAKDSQRFQLSDAQAKTLRSILRSPAIHEPSADPVIPSGFFYLDGKCVYWRGIGLSLNPEAGSHWRWRGGPFLEHLNLSGSADNSFDTEAGVRRFLRQLD
jgi:hypothetical protein